MSRTNISSPYLYTLANGSAVRVRLYAYNPDFKKATVVFKYSDLINRAIRYKEANPAVDVELRFAIYKMARRVYIGFKPGTDSYGWVGGTEDHGPFADADGADSEKLIYSVFKAAMANVKVVLVYHNPDDDEIGPYLDDMVASHDVPEGCLSYVRASWPEGSTRGQMHNKFLLASHIEADEDDPNALEADGYRYYTNCAYITTANVDHFDSGKGDWYRPVSTHRMSQAATTVYGHCALYAAYVRYFGIVCANATDQTDFWSAMTEAHNNGTLNYLPSCASDPCEAYFFPIPERQENAWDTTFNPLAKYVEALNTDGNRYFKMNVYHFKSDPFGLCLKDQLQTLHDGGSVNIKSAFNKNSLESGDNNFPEFDGQVYPAATHAKCYMFAMSETGHYYCIIGSSNAKADAFNSKANNLLVFRELAGDGSHVLYDFFKEPIWTDAYDS